MGVQGFAVAVLCVLVVGVLVPWAVRGRAVLAAARLEDRSSHRMHLVAVGGTARARTLHRPGQCSRPTRRKAALVTRPADLTRASAADARHLAVARARLAARRSRRAAGRRRRTTLNLALVALTVIVLTLGLTTALSAWWALLPFIACAASLVASRRADIAAAHRDRNDEAELDAMEERLALTVERARSQRAERDRQVAVVREARAAAQTRAQRAEQAAPALAAAQRPEAPATRTAAGGRGSTAVDAAAAAPAEVAPAAAAPAARTVRTRPVTVESGWSPSVVPAPLYTVKLGARRAVEPYTQEEAPGAAVPARPTRTAQASAPLGSAARELVDQREQQPPAETIDLTRVLEDRRARGA